MLPARFRTPALIWMRSTAGGSSCCQSITSAERNRRPASPLRRFCRSRKCTPQLPAPAPVPPPPPQLPPRPQLRLLECLSFENTILRVGKRNSYPAVWSRGMIPALGAGGPGFKPRLGPFCSVQSLHTFVFVRICGRNNINAQDRTGNLSRVRRTS